MLANQEPDWLTAAEQRALGDPDMTRVVSGLNSVFTAPTHDLLSPAPARLAGKTKKSLSQIGVDSPQKRWENPA